MISVVLSLHGHQMGVVVIDKKDPSMYCVRDGIKLWLETHLYATDIDFPWGKGIVTYTAGGGCPYQGEMAISRSMETCIIRD